MRAALLHACWLLMVLALSVAAYAGGPVYVAGSGFDSGVAGTPLTWVGGQISYYTDQGDLGPVLPQSAADALVADAFSRWTSVTTAALSATRAGQLDEDVSGANVTRAGTVLAMPADIQPDSPKPLAIVYDADGRVIEALLGAGAADASYCDSNAVVGGPDRFTSDGHIAHALLILNGNCAQTSAGLPLLRYLLVRAIGRALGLDWSQLNDNVATGAPSPTADDQAGFPLMHPRGSLCSLAYGCVYGADQPRLDDRAAVSRLYPVTAENLAQFPGKSEFAGSTARLRGRILFPGWNGAAGAGMQGVNVVARWIDSSTGVASHALGASSVSGFLFRGDAGNEITGFTSAGARLDHWGSADTSLRGFYDLAGLEIPAGFSSAQFQLTVEPLNPDYTGAVPVGPYKLSQVAPSGTAAPVVITLARGADVVQDIVMQQAAANPSDAYEPHSFSQPAAIPGAGHWTASLGAYGDFDWHSFGGHANRRFTLDLTALDESGDTTTRKALPVLGLWAADAAESDPPLASQTWFNLAGGTTRMQATLPADGVYKLAIADARGDGRPDFGYRARLLYADSVSPSHAFAGGGLRITGLGFTPGLRVTIGGVAASVLSYTVNELLVYAPALPDGTKDIALTDPATGATATLMGAVSYGGVSNDKLQLLSGYNPPVPVGAMAPYPFRVRVVASDGVTPIAGAAVTFTASSASVAVLPCNLQVCTITSDGTGEADAGMMVKAAGVSTVTASLAGGDTTSATVNGVAGPLQISSVPPKIYVAAGATASLELLARVVGDGAPLPGREVDFQIMVGAATLTASAVVTDSNGEARSTLRVVNLALQVRVSACVGVSPQIACNTFDVYPVIINAGIQLLKASGDSQYVPAGQSFAPVSVRVFDMNVPPNPVSGVPVNFQVSASLSQPAASTEQAGELVTGHRAQPVTVTTSDTTIYSDAWGRASITPQFPAEWGALRVSIQATIGGAPAVSFTVYTMPTDGGAFSKSPEPRVPINY